MAEILYTALEMLLRQEGKLYPETAGSEHVLFLTAEKKHSTKKSVSIINSD